MTTSFTKLDSPVWHSLLEAHSAFAINMGNIRFYQPDYCPFGGFISEENIADALDRYAEQCPGFYVVGLKPAYSNNLRLIKDLVCNQMVLEAQIRIETDEAITELGEKQRDDLFNLVNFVQPGYFRRRTAGLGSYFGIYKNDELIAVTGERMKMSNYTEVSAVVTHPDHTGRGYAKKLIAFTTDLIFKENKIPFLHVAETNTAAINLYEKLGFKTRRKISFWHFVKA